MRAIAYLEVLTIASLFAASPLAAAQEVTPPEVQWKTGRVAGLERANLVGEPGKAGPVTFRLRFPANYTLQAHTFPDNRTYTVLSGTWYLGWGEKLDEARLKALPAGSFYVLPANTAHFAATKGEPVVLQVTGTEPSAARFLKP